MQRPQVLKNGRTNHPTHRMFRGDLMIEGNIVATYKYPHCTVHISDSAYAGKSEAQKDQERDNARRLAGKYYRKALEDEMERLRASGMREDTIQEKAENILVARVREAKIQWNMIIWGTPDGGEPENL